MAEILKDWLSERLQRPITWEADEFGDMMKDGHVISDILLSYHVITEEKHFLIRVSNIDDDIKRNWIYLSEWLRELNIHLNDSELNNVKEGKGSALLRLFYQLFLHLDKRDRIDYIKRERKMASSLVEKLGGRFKVEKIEEEVISEIDDLSKPLLDERHFIEWQKQKSAQVQDTYDYLRHRYLKTCGKIEESKEPLNFKPVKPEKLTTRDKKDIDFFLNKYPCKFANYSYDQLLELEQQANENKVNIIDTDWAKNYVKNLHTKMRNRSDSEKFQNQLSNVLDGSLWEMTVGEEENRHDTELAKKVMKLSQFEKQMCTQIMETKQQSRNLIKNRIKAEKEFSDQREQQFNQFLDNIKEQIHLEVVEIDFEKERQNMLHRRLYAEKMKRKRQHYYEICYETMLSIVDYATKYGYFKLLIGDDIPEHFIREWKALFYKKQPIFDLLEEVEVVIEDHGIHEAEAVVEEEPIIREELDRQDCMDESEFEDYHTYSALWNLDNLIPNYDSESEERRWEYLGWRILGHVVFTLLELKYPYPPKRQPADLPDFPSKVILRGLPDSSITVPMQTLLDLRKIHVVRLENAINYCLKAYKKEMIGCIDIELTFDKFITLAPEECKDVIRAMKAADSKNELTNFVIPPNTKQVQTPKTIPEEEIVLSKPAELGKYAYETLCSGDSLTDHLIAAMIVEYLRNTNDINGFVIINYPNTYREAQIVEEVFSGREPPDEHNLDDRDDIYLEESIQKHRKIEKDPYKLIRVSRLVINPHKKAEEPPFTSYFTSYIRLQPTEDILQEYFIWELDEENSEMIDRFYACLGINYSMYYEFIEKEFLAHLCRYIIGELEVPIKSFDNLFGEEVLSLLNFPTTEDKRQKSKIVKPELSNEKSKEKLRKGSKASKQMLSREIIKKEDSMIPEHLESLVLLEEVEDDNKSTSIVTEEIIVLPGEEDWEYVELPISEPIGIALASIWEQVESNYIHDMRLLFFAKRLQMNCLVPYARFIKDKMDQIITLPSHKQDLVVKFQSEYNAFEDDWRNTNVTKNEWHCRIKELQNRLYHICDDRKMNAERQRQALIADNWAMDELTSMVNTYVSCMQTELNRYVLTLQVLHDFYYTLLRHAPSSDRLSSKDLTKITRDLEENIESKKLSAEDKAYRQLKNAYIEMQLKNVSIDFSNNPFNMIIENNTKFAFKVIKDFNDSFRSLINKEHGEISKMTPAKPKKDDVDAEENAKKEELFKVNGYKCIEEWTMAVNGEMYRANLRIQALQYRCYVDMKLFNDYIYKTLSDIQQSINVYYINEIKSVDRLCKYLQMAVETGKKVEESLILEHDTFIIDPNLLQYIPPEPTPDTALEEMVTDMQFKIGQLARLRHLFKIVAPTGLSMQKPFIYLLQDFIFYGRETYQGGLVPKAWQHIDPEDVPKLVYSIFGDTVYVDWRDFLIFCLNIRYPTTDELLELRRKFRCMDLNSTELIDRDSYLKEELWFEEDFEIGDPYAQLRLNLIKHFLFELFETSQDMMNYSAFLLAFCKNFDPLVGFTAALSMAVGKKICHEGEECNKVIQKYIKIKEYNDACKACAKKCAEEFIEKLLDTVMDNCIGTVITEIEFIEPVVDKKKKGKVPTSKGKERDSQSARGAKPKIIGLSKTKLAQSATDMDPCVCKLDSAPTLSKLEEMEEESRWSIQPDPYLAYSVSQNVIWNILKICLPWPFEIIPDRKPTGDVDEMKLVFGKLENDTEDGSIYIMKFIKDPYVCKLLHKMKKFYDINLPEEVKKILI